jgi:hypothetical protein
VRAGCNPGLRRFTQSGPVPTGLVRPPALNRHNQEYVQNHRGRPT